MFYVYVLQSKIEKNWLYIGFTSDIKKRLYKHNLGNVKSTKSRRLFILVYYEAYKNATDAKVREKHLKSHQQRDLLKGKLENSLLK